MKALFAVSVLAATCVATPAVAQDLGIEVGTTAPAVSVQALDGKTVSLANYFGKQPVLIEFWATWCPNCRELMPALLDAEKKYGSKVKFMAIAVAILVQYYGQAQGSPSSPVAAYAAAEPPAQPAPAQPGLLTTSPRPTGVFAQPPSRDLYFGTTSTFIRR